MTAFLINIFAASCVKVSVDFDVIGKHKIEFPGNIVLRGIKTTRRHTCLNIRIGN
jgi:hypothetical protein